MKKFFIVLLLIICACNNIKENEFEKIELDELQTIASHFSRDEIKNYTNQSFQKLLDSIDNNSGFFGFKNIRDYANLGDEKMHEKVNRIWYGIYDIDSISKIANSNIHALKIEKQKLNNPLNVTIKRNNIIEIYSHKVGLSFGLLLIEIIISASLASWLFTIIINLLVLTPIIPSNKVVYIVCYTIAFIIFAIFVYSEYKSQREFESYISKEITEQTMREVNRVISNID